MDTVVPKTWVTLDAGLFSENVVVLALKMANDFGETRSKILAPAES